MSGRETGLLLKISDLDIKMKYVYEKDQKYNGQLKLFFTTLNFLLDNISKGDIILYIGSGKGYNIPLLIELFNDYDLSWHLYDPTGHCTSLENNGDIMVNNKLFDINEAKKFVKIENLIFISDIRTVENISVKSVDLLRDYELQNNLVDFLNPKISFLKWRCPFPDDWIKDFKIPSGDEYLQPYVSKFSNELRLVCKRPYIYKSIAIDDSRNYEELLYYYNKVLRKKNELKIVRYILDKLTYKMKKILNIDDFSTKQSVQRIIDLIQIEKYKK